MEGKSDRNGKAVYFGRAQCLWYDCLLLRRAHSPDAAAAEPDDTASCSIIIMMEEEYGLSFPF